MGKEAVEVQASGSSIQKDTIDSGEITDAHCLRDFPTNYQKSPFVQLTYASEFDRALEYQPLVARELAQQGYIYDLNMTVPEPTLMHDLSQDDLLWSQPVQTPPDVEMVIPAQEGVEQHAQFEEVIFMTEEERVMLDTIAATSAAME
eukprot:5983323-Amphidinium_carterae.1